MVSITLVILFIVLAGHVNGQELGFDCRRNGATCIGNDCNMVTGKCACLEGTEGYNCEMVSANKGQCSTVPEEQCQNGATCLTGDSTCYCSSEYYGTYCQNRRVKVWCSDNEMFININPDVTPPFEGKLFVSADPVEGGPARDAAQCQLIALDNGSVTLPKYVLDENQAVPTELAGFYLQIQHNVDGAATGVCGSVIPQNVTDDEGNLVRTEYIRRVAIEYNSLVMSSLDQMLNVNCSIANAENITTFSSFSAVSVAILDDDYQQVNISDTLEPVRFEIQDSNNRSITNSVNLGDQINLKFTLDSTATGFSKIKIIQCKAKSGAEGALEITFLDDNCPAPEWVELFRDHMTEDDTDKSTTLHLSAFRFTGDSDSVTFTCNLRLCTEADVAECARNPACDPEATTGEEGTTAAPGNTTATSEDATEAPDTTPPPQVRRKRSAGEEKQLQSHITVRSPVASRSVGAETKETTTVEDEDCMLHSEVVIIIVTFTVALTLMLILIVVLVIRLLRSRQKVVDVSDAMSAHSHSQYTLPRVNVASF